MCDLTTILGPASSAECEITIVGKTDRYVGGTVTDVLVWDFWLVGSDEIPSGTIVSANWDVHEGIWRVAQAPCS